MRPLPDDFIAALEATAAAYLTHSDPIRGYLLECLVTWGAPAGQTTVGSIPEAQFGWIDAR
ncbi:MAG TPA: hypothetical protein VGJ78_19080 [Vicinamibacterales bacterium]|jgi:hypothetical protein